VFYVKCLKNVFPDLICSNWNFYWSRKYKISDNLNYSLKYSKGEFRIIPNFHIRGQTDSIHKYVPSGRYHIPKSQGYLIYDVIRFFRHFFCHSDKCRGFFGGLAGEHIFSRSFPVSAKSGEIKLLVSLLEQSDTFIFISPMPSAADDVRFDSRFDKRFLSQGCSSISNAVPRS